MRQRSAELQRLKSLSCSFGRRFEGQLCGRPDAFPQVIKCRLQVQGAATAGGAANLAAPKYRGPIDCALQTVKIEGVTGLFRGLTALLARDIPFNALFFGFYDAYCKLILALPLPWRDLAHKSDMTAAEILIGECIHSARSSVVAVD